MLCKDVLHNKPYKIKNVLGTIMLIVLIIIGCLHTVGHIKNSKTMKGLAFTTVASPLPLVFSAYNGVETFSTSFEFELLFNNGTIINKTIDNKLYGKLKGAYNRRNMYGVIFSHGPFFNMPNQIKMRDQTLHWGSCNQGRLMDEFGISGLLKRGTILIKSKTVGNEDRLWKINVDC